MYVVDGEMRYQGLDDLFERIAKYDHIYNAKRTLVEVTGEECVRVECLSQMNSDGEPLSVAEFTTGDNDDSFTVTHHNNYTDTTAMYTITTGVYEVDCFLQFCATGNDYYRDLSCAARSDKQSPPMPLPEIHNPALVWYNMTP